MDETSILERMMLFGLTRVEAGIYICLFKSGELTGYEVAKQTGISRSNVYSGLSGLVDKGGAYLIEGISSKYVAVPIEEFCDNKIRNMKRDKEFLVKNMPAVTAAEDGYITIEGAKNIKDKILTMLDNAKQRIYLSAPESFIQSIETELLETVRRKIKLVLITDKDVGMSETIQYLTDKKENQIRLIIDSLYVLTGDIQGEKSDTCLYSGQKNFVNVFKESLRNEIKLIELTGGEKKDE
ncbi:sugar-specific transcriptional regulator TrmB [Kineothrix alysoides]|uniref:Sugar-specific transcriptional regulator TrmB n=1 Tax=Kineothrix alysoides TaxID=1469948 RepID=A0A4V2QBA5_9FIRM|nr:helix-turn-helix domain-containing protein [Kineothrix alysoides]TCL55612.1 sugar-specific transcriptional regulator TrmB [Kineothrix alysoides]